MAIFELPMVYREHLNLITYYGYSNTADLQSSKSADDDIDTQLPRQSSVDLGLPFST